LVAFFFPRQYNKCNTPCGVRYPQRESASEFRNTGQPQFRVPPMILRVFASKSSQIELRQPERGEGVLILCACRQPQQRICTLMFEHACGKRSVPLVWLISAMGLFRATFPTDFGPKIRKNTTSRACFHAVDIASRTGPLYAHLQRRRSYPVSK